MTLLTRYDRFDPFDELSTLRNRMDRLMTRFVAPENAPETELFNTRWTPATDIVETKDSLLMKTELPGLTEKDVHIKVENGVLTIEGERNIEKDTSEKDFRRVERAYGKFFRTFTLPTNVLPDKITATFTNGVLELAIPKKEEAKPITIDVKKKLTAAA